jgi:hypothetical protein
MVIYGNYAYPYPHLSARGPYNSSTFGNSNLSNFKLQVMPYDEDLREGFETPSNVAIYVLVAIVVILFLFALYLARARG